METILGVISFLFRSKVIIWAKVYRNIFTQECFYTKILASILHVCVVPITMHADKCIPVFFTRYLDLSSLCVHLLCVLAVKSSGSGV